MLEQTALCGKCLSQIASQMWCWVSAGLLESLGRTFGVQGHADEGLVLVGEPAARVGQQADPVRLHAVGDPHLAPVDDVVPALLLRSGLDAWTKGRRERHDGIIPT